MNLRVFGLLLALMPLHAHAQCRLCTPAPDNGAVPVADRPLTISIETALDFSRVAQSRGGGGSIALDARSGSRAVSGGLVDLGGMALKGTVRVTGEPDRHVRVSMPPTIRLTASDGGAADVIDLRTDLPPDPMLDAFGMLSFAFGGRLVVSGTVSGDFRGRIPIVVDYP